MFYEMRNILLTSSCRINYDIWFFDSSEAVNNGLLS